MNLHEYQSKRLFADFGITVPRGIPAKSPNAAVDAAKELGGEFWVVKAQVHAGGRGKAGGVKLAHSRDEVHQHAEAMLGMQLVTHQSGPEGLPVNVVYVEEGSDIDRELYLSMLVDREVSRVAFIASAAGGMDIEKVAAETPEKIFTIAIAPDAGLQDFQARQLGFGLGLDKKQMRQFGNLIRRMYQLYEESDASLVEVNPLITTKGGDVVALDAKISSRSSLSCVTLRKKTTKSVKQRRTISTTFLWTVISPAWLMAPGSRWRRWTLSSCTVVNRRTFSTLAAERQRSEWPRRSS